MIQVFVDPTLKNSFDIGEIENHSQLVKRICLKSYEKSAIVPVKISAFALVLK